jgi:hypothetical protein
MEHFLIRVRTDSLVISERAMALWIVRAESAHKALEIVRATVARGCEVEMTDHKLQPETIQRLGLGDGQAWHL